MGGTDRQLVAGGWPGSALLCFTGTFAGVAYRSLSRFVGVNVAVWMAAGADLHRFRNVSPATIGWRVCAPVYPGILCGFAACPRGSAGRSTGQRDCFRTARDAEHFGLRRVWPVVCTECDLSCRTAAVAEASGGRCGMAIAVAGYSGPDESEQCPGGS